MTRLGSVHVQSTNSPAPERLTVLVQGPPKTGKTHLWTTFPRPFAIYYDPNLATLSKFPGISYCTPTSYSELAMSVLPEIQHRKLDADTIVLDSASFLADRLLNELQGGRPKLDHSGWGLLLSRLSSTMNILVDAARPLPGRPDARSYHIVVTVHERAEQTEQGGLVKVTPAISGSFRDSIARYFNTVLLSAIETQLVQQPQPGGGTKAVREARYLVHTVPPDDFHHCGDGVGGGKYRVLPPKLENTYGALTAAWGYEGQPQPAQGVGEVLETLRTAMAK